MFFRNVLAVAAALAHLASARDAFAHYMAQGMSQADANLDVADAQYAGISAFAVNLNSGDVNQGWAKESIEYLCKAAEDSQAAGKYFAIFFSMDIWNSNNADAFKPLLNTYMNRGCHYKYDNKYFLSTFNAGSTTNTYWSNFFSTLSKKRNQIYFVPNFDNTNGYYSSDANWWNYWGKTVDGLFTWETVWPSAAGEVTIDRDNKVAQGAVDHSKSYMVGLSSLQYKHWDKGNGGHEHRYRRGLDTLPKRMEQILDMSPKAEFAETITWNDAGESHYIGTLHKQGVGAFWGYANNDEYRHTAWQPLVKSFNVAFKAGLPASGMRPVNGDDITGALWHRAFLKSSLCASDPWGKPKNSGWAKDTINWAVVMPDNISGARVQVYSGGNQIYSAPVQPGLNYGSAENMVAGPQYVEVVRNVNGGTEQLYSKTSHVAVTANPKDNICNYNYVVDILLKGGPN
ncbi:hypothetical protein PG995_004773 [Apiospora arundinis]